jgi:hypothetical protein
MLKHMLHLLAILIAATLSAGQAPFAAGASAVIATTNASNGWAVNYPKQRKLFVMAGRLWVLYSDGAHGVYRTSADGATWSDPVLFGEGGHFGHRFGGWFDGTYFHYTLCTAGLGADVRYRRGMPQPDGTITWTMPEQTAYDTPADKNVMYPKIIVDSEGCPWITFMELVYQEPNTPPYDAVVIKASTNDGAWRTAEGFPFDLVDQKPVAGYPDPVGVPLTAGKTAWIYNPQRDGTDVHAARIWNGSAWQDEEIIVSPAPIYAFFNAVADGDDIHLVHGAGSIQHQKRTWGTGWGAPFTLADNASGHTAITRTGPNSVIVTWLDLQNNRVHYRESREGEWGTEVLWQDEQGESLAGAGINLNTLISAEGPFSHAVAYTTGNTAPFTIKVSTLSAPASGTS